MSTILLVEGIRPKASLAPILERRKYTVICATNSKEAVARAKEHALSLIILDATAARTDGVRLCRDVRAQLDSVAILLLVRPSALIDAACGADYVLPQPFTPRKLLNRVARMLPSGEADVISAGDLTLNISNRCVRLGRKEHQLTPKQSQLLEIFMRQPNEVVTRRQLMKQVWETDYMGDTRTLDVHVRWLRQIIESDPDQPRRLVTVRSVGYKLKI